MPRHFATVIEVLRYAYMAQCFDLFDVDAKGELFWLTNPKCERNRAGLPNKLLRCEYSGASKTWVVTEKSFAL